MAIGDWSDQALLGLQAHYRKIYREEKWEPALTVVSSIKLTLEKRELAKKEVK